MAINLDAKSLLQRYGQTKQTEIERLLSQYGTSLKETREMYPQLTSAIEQRRLATTFPTQELFFTSTEAAQMGLPLQEGWMMKMTPDEAQKGYGISFITPQKWEITEGDLYISPTGEQYSRADLEALMAVPTGLEGVVPPTGPMTIENLTEEGQRQYQEYQQSGGKLGIEDWINLRERQQLETEEVFGAVFPEQDIQEVLDYMQTDPEGFLADIREIGPTEDMVALLKSLEFEDEAGNVRNLTDAEIQDMFGAPVPEYVPEHWLKDAFDALLVGGRAFVYGQRQRFTSILPALFSKFIYTPAPTEEEEAAWYAHMTPPEPSPLPLITQEELKEISEGAAPLSEEYLDLFKDIPSIRRLSDKDIERLRNLKSALKESEQHFIKLMDEEAEWHLQHPELTPRPLYLESPWEHPELFRDPGYISYTISSSLVYSLSVMATLITVSSVASPTAGVFAALEVAVGPESTSMTEELVRQGVPFEDAIRWGELYGHAAGGIEVVSDLPFVGLIFKPIGAAVKPMWNTIFRGVSNRLAKRILTGLMIPQFEGLEEVVTQVVHNAILKHYDETQSILEDVSHAYIQGVIASTPFGAIGGKASFNTFYDKLSPQMQQQYDALVDRFQNAGLTKQQAQVQATNELAKTPEGEAELSEAIEAAQEEYREEHPEVTPPKPELAEEVLKEIEVAEEVAKPTEVTPGIATGQEYTATVYRGYKVGGAPTDEGLFGKGTYYTTNKEYAETYDGKEVLKVTLKNPFVINTHQEAETFWNETTRPAREAALNEGKTVEEADELAAQAARQWLESRGYDGLIARNIIAPGDEVVVFEPEKAMGPKVPVTEAGMPEAGLQPSMLAEVPAKEVRPEARGKLVQSRLDDYLRLREYNKERVSDRIAEIKKILEAKGRTPKGEATKGNLRLEFARLEALQEVDAVEIVEELDRLIREVGDEIGLRSMPYQGYGGKSHIDLVRHPERRLFKGYTSRQLEEMLKVYEQARQAMSPEVPAISPIKAEDISTDIPALTSTQLTAQQIEKTIELFKESVAAPNTEMQRAAALELRKHVFAQRAQAASESAEAMIAEGMNPEEAIKTAEQQFMTGKLPDLTTDYFNDLTQEMRNVLFAKVYNYWHDKPGGWTELISTFEALTNALAGRTIPRVKGIGTKYFPDGGSAWDRLARVFIGDMEVLETLDQGKPLSKIIEGVLLETGRGSLALNQETVNWLKELSTISEEDRILLEKPLSEITEAEVRRIAQQWFYGRRNELNTLLKDGVITKEEYKLQLAIAKDRVFPYGQNKPIVSYPTETFEQLPLLTLREKGTIVRTLKNIGLSIIDIGNLVRANKASFDFSFWRQARALATGHPVAFYRSNIDAWKAMWSQEEAEAQWQRITRDPDYELYEQIRLDTGADPLRILESPKGTAQWRAAEEMGYLTGERAIPRFTARIPWIKVSGRAFVGGCNSLVWSVWKQCLAATRARAMRIASGDIKLEEGEGFSISEEMVDYQKYIADAIQRASLGKAAPLAPALGSLLFAPRSKLARLLYPRHLVSSNPRVRALAWKDFSLFIGSMSGLVMLGYWLGLWDVERDPRNAEFMSIRIGNMRIDPWAGHRQFVVLYSRLVTGTGLSSVTGQEYEVNPIAALTTFFRTSLSPLMSILWDSWTGKNFLGEKLDIANPKQWIERIAPFAVQDVWEAFQEDWQKGLIAILPAIVGEGVQTYTGDWREDWAKLGLPKYPENTGYGIDEPVYDIADFWADTASQFRGVDVAGLTESKGYPEYVRSIAQALQIIEQIESLPNKRLALINADPEEGTTFKQYYEMWQERQRIVASGDEEALKAFDADERTRNAYLGNMTQAQYALLMEYHSLPESEKAEFLGNHPELYIDPRDEWLRSHPEENALLALWGKSKIYSEEAESKLVSLAKSLGIPENAMIERDLDTVTQLRLKHRNLFDLLDVYSGLDDTVKDDEGLTAHDRAIKELYEDNPDFRDDMRRIEALGKGTEDNPTPEEIVEAWVNRGIIVDEYGASSAETRLFLIDNKEVHQWALDTGLLSDDGADWNEPILRLTVQYRDDFDLYEAYGDISSDNYIEDDGQRAEARRRLLFDEQEMTSFGKAYYTGEASSQGYSEVNWPAFVEYAALPLWGSWRERFLLDNPSFYKEYTNPDIGNHPLLDQTRVKPIARDKIYQQFYDEFQAWDETGGMAPKAIENMRAELDVIERGGLTFIEARYSVQAYDNGFSENLIDDYVEWYSTERKDYEDDWWLMEHKEFYDTMYKLELWTEKRDFSKVPTREVYALYQTYLGLPSGNPRYDFRAKHPDLDAWLVLKFGYKPIGDRGEAGDEKTPWEEAAEVGQFKELFK